MDTNQDAETLLRRYHGCERHASVQGGAAFAGVGRPPGCARLPQRRRPMRHVPGAHNQLTQERSHGIVHLHIE
jgi:hypothetical protein